MVQAAPFLALEFLSSPMLGKQGRGNKHDRKKKESECPGPRTKDREKAGTTTKACNAHSKECKQFIQKLTRGLLGEDE
jgi:hypothetical protein